MRLLNNLCGSTREDHALQAYLKLQVPQMSMLAACAGATRRNRPNLQPGDLVYCRVLTASRNLEPTLSCVDASGKVTLAACVLVPPMA